MSPGAGGVAGDGVLVGLGKPCGLADAAAVGEGGEDVEGLRVGELGSEEGGALRSEKRYLQARQERSRVWFLPSRAQAVRLPAPRWPYSEQSGLRQQKRERSSAIGFGGS
jgi:hypothetical protein